MTTVYFVRHAESKYNSLDDFSRPLTPKGMADRERVTDFLSDKHVDIIFSSPYKRAIDTISHFAEKNGLKINIIDDFRERTSGSEPATDFLQFAKKQWEDFSYKLPGGECLGEVQGRNIDALKALLKEYDGKTLVIGSHGTALSTIINYYNNLFSYGDFVDIANIMPWIVQFNFNGQDCDSIQMLQGVAE